LVLVAVKTREGLVDICIIAPGQEAGDDEGDTGSDAKPMEEF